MTKRLIAVAVLGCSGPTHPMSAPEPRAVVAAIPDAGADAAPDAWIRADWPVLPDAEHENVDPYANVPKPSDPPRQPAAPVQSDDRTFEQNGVTVVVRRNQPAKWCAESGKAKGLCFTERKQCTGRCVAKLDYVCMEILHIPSKEQRPWCFPTYKLCDEMEGAIQNSDDYAGVTSCTVYLRRKDK